MERRPYKALEEVVVPVKPWITAGLLLLCIWAFFESSSHGLLWVKRHALCCQETAYLFSHNKIMDIAQTMFWASFAQANIWHLFGNLYFLWVFGTAVEPRLGTFRYLLLVGIAMLGGWTLLYHDAGAAMTTRYVGPGLLTAGIIGAYLVFFPEKKINPAGTFRPSYKIFRDEPTPDPAQAYGVNPWLVIAAFIAFQYVMHLVLSKMTIGIDTMRLIPAIETMLLGLGTCLVLVLIATGRQGGHPLQRLAVQRYQQLRALDMTHDEAIMGAARLLSIPPEQVKTWVSKGGGPLPQA